MPGETGADRQVMRGVQPADQGPAVACITHRSRPAMLDRGALGHEIAQTGLDRLLHGGRRGLLVHRLGLERDVAPAADHESPVGHLAPVLVTVVGIDRSRVELHIERGGGEHLATARHDQLLQRRHQLRCVGVRRQHQCARLDRAAVRAHLPHPIGVPARAQDAAAFVQARALSLCLVGDAELEPHGMHDAILGDLERGVELGHRVRGEHILTRDLAHRETVMAQLGQRAAQVLGLLLGARQAQAAGATVVAIDAQRFGQVRDTLMCASPDLQHGTSALATPERDALGVWLRGLRQQEAGVTAAR